MSKVCHPLVFFFFCSLLLLSKGSFSSFSSSLYGEMGKMAFFFWILISFLSMLVICWSRSLLFLSWRALNLLAPLWLYPGGVAFRIAKSSVLCRFFFLLFLEDICWAGGFFS